MHLITKEFEELFIKYPISSQRKSKDPLVIAQLLDISGSATWYLTEYNPETKEAFGYLTGLGEDEWEYISIVKLQNMRHRFFPVPRIERDEYFEQKPISHYVPSALEKAA